jgi:hypothetical protein
LTYSGIKPSNFEALVQYYKKHEPQFSSAAEEIQKNSGIQYPAMKLVDMYFWEIGYELEQKALNNPKE